ncbi:MAG: hypothetical protein ACTSVL_03240 [Promethearchaeota archaeon]
MYKLAKQGFRNMILFGIFFSIISSLTILSVGASDEINIHLNKIVGTDISNKISGKFRITVDGSDDIVHISVFFNDSLVKEEDGNALSLTFQTHDYPYGLMNITAVGVNLAGDHFQASKIVEFFDSSTFDTVLWIIAGVAIIPFIIFYVRKLVKKRKKQENHGEFKEKIHIDIDKDFR